MSKHPAFAPLSGGSGATAGRGKSAPADLVAVMPVPADAPAAPRRHPRHGEPTGRWAYHSLAGELLGYQCRFDLPDGSKTFQPQALFRPATGGAPQWRWKAWPEPRPLYGLDRLGARPGAPVLLCEGEKAADAAGELAPDYVAVTSPNGSKSAGKADWSVLRGRRVVIWPDADAAGLAYAEAAAGLILAAGAASVATIAPPADASCAGWDAADALAEGWSTARVVALLAAAVPRLPNSAGQDQKAEPESGRPKRERAGDGLLALTSACRLWHSPDREAFATFPVREHFETWPVCSLTFKDWLAERCEAELGAVPGAQAIEDVVRILRARAIGQGVEQKPWLRTGSRNGRIYIDLCDRAWRAVEISASPLEPDGRCWRILQAHDLPFVRASAMRPLPLPETDDVCSLDELRPFVNSESDADFMLVGAWLLAAMRPRGPYPVLVLNGPQGTGKSVLSTLLRSLIDPNLAPIRAAPRDDRDLIIAAVNSHCLCIDNMSSVPAWLADALCRLATGGGFAARSMYQDRVETVLEAQRPILLNGIPALTDRPDLASRALTVRLRTIPDAQRRPEDEMHAAWDAAQPRVLAALFDAVATALRRLPETRLDGSPRLADFAKWIVAAESGLGWEAGAFLQAYAENRKDINESAFEASPVAMALEAFAQERRLWAGTATELLALINDKVPETTRRLKLWPQHAQSLGNTIERVEPLLRPRGIRIERRHSGQRTITVSCAGT